MSSHYEWSLSLYLRPDVPPAFLAELRYHLGLTARPPEHPELEVDWPCLTTAPEDHLAWWRSPLHLSHCADFDVRRGRDGGDIEV